MKQENDDSHENYDDDDDEPDLLNHWGFALLKADTWHHYVRKYEIIIGRSSKSAPVDVVLGEGMNISRRHAQIAYNFDRGRFELRVCGKNGVTINDVLCTVDHTIPLKSKDKIVIGSYLFYFLLPVDLANFAGNAQMKQNRKRRRSSAKGVEEGGSGVKVQKTGDQQMGNGENVEVRQDPEREQLMQQQKQERVTTEKEEEPMVLEQAKSNMGVPAFQSDHELEGLHKLFAKDSDTPEINGQDFSESLQKLESELKINRNMNMDPLSSLTDGVPSFRPLLPPHPHPHPHPQAPSMSSLFPTPAPPLSHLVTLQNQPPIKAEDQGVNQRSYMNYPTQFVPQDLIAPRIGYTQQQPQQQPLKKPYTLPNWSPPFSPPKSFNSKFSMSQLEQLLGLRPNAAALRASGSQLADVLNNNNNNSNNVDESRTQLNQMQEFKQYQHLKHTQDAGTGIGLGVGAALQGEEPSKLPWAQNQFHREKDAVSFEDSLSKIIMNKSPWYSTGVDESIRALQAGRQVTFQSQQLPQQRPQMQQQNLSNVQNIQGVLPQQFNQGQYVQGLVQVSTEMQRHASGGDVAQKNNVCEQQIDGSEQDDEQG